MQDPHQDRGQTKLNKSFTGTACRVYQLYEAEGSPFLKCVVSIWALPERGRGGVKAYQDGL